MNKKFCTIAKDGTISTVVDLEDLSILGLLVPALDSANLTFTASDTSDGTFVTVKTVYLDSTDSFAATLADFTIPAATGGIAIDSSVLDALKGYRYIKVVASAGQTTAARTFTWILKKNYRR